MDSVLQLTIYRQLVLDLLIVFGNSHSDLFTNLPRAAFVGGGPVSADPLLFERRKGKMMIFFWNLTDPSFEKNWTPSFNILTRALNLLSLEPALPVKIHYLHFSMLASGHSLGGKIK